MEQEEFVKKQRELYERVHKEGYVIAEEVIALLKAKNLSLKDQSRVLSKAYHIVRKQSRANQ